MFRTLILSTLLLAAVACEPSPVSITAAPDDTSPPDDPATVTFVFDGDSIEVAIGGQTEEVRLLGINAPEADECYGDESRDGLRSIIDGQEVTLVRGSADDRDEFGRLLRYVHNGAQNVNEAVLFHGRAVMVQSDHDRNDDFVSITADAARREVGMWAPNACGPATRRDVVVSWVEYNPPGPDDDVLNEEYVEIVNEGSLRVDLAGWILRDESSRNRYVFDRALRAGGRLVVHTGCGSDRGVDVYWCADHSLWSNGGDTAILQDEHGNVVSWRTYRGG